MKITVHTVKCNGTYHNLFSAAMNYLSAFFSVYNPRYFRNLLGLAYLGVVTIKIRQGEKWDEGPNFEQ